MKKYSTQFYGGKNSRRGKKKGLEIKAGSDTARQEVVQTHKHICNSYASFLML